MMNVRFAGTEDIDALIRLRLAFFSEDPELALTEEKEAAVTAQLRPYFTEHLNRDFFAALADQDGAVAAVSYLAIHVRPGNYRCPTGKFGEILNVYTLPEYRLKGYATAALKQLIDKSREENVSYLELSASRSGKPVYEKLGFVDKPERSFTEMVLTLI